MLTGSWWRQNVGYVELVTISNVGTAESIIPLIQVDLSRLEERVE